MRGTSESHCERGREDRHSGERDNHLPPPSQQVMKCRILDMVLPKNGYAGDDDDDDDDDNRAIRVHQYHDTTSRPRQQLPPQSIRYHRQHQQREQPAGYAYRQRQDNDDGGITNNFVDRPYSSPYHRYGHADHDRDDRRSSDFLPPHGGYLIPPPFDIDRRPSFENFNYERSSSDNRSSRGHRDTRRDISLWPVSSRKGESEKDDDAITIAAAATDDDNDNHGITDDDANSVYAKAQQDDDKALSAEGESLLAEQPGEGLKIRRLQEWVRNYQGAVTALRRACLPQASRWARMSPRQRRDDDDRSDLELVRQRMMDAMRRIKVVERGPSSLVYGDDDGSDTGVGCNRIGIRRGWSNGERCAAAAAAAADDDDNREDRTVTAAPGASVRRGSGSIVMVLADDHDDEDDGDRTAQVGVGYGGRRRLSERRNGNNDTSSSVMSNIIQAGSVRYPRR